MSASDDARSHQFSVKHWNQIFRMTLREVRMSMSCYFPFSIFVVGFGNKFVSSTINRQF